MFINITKLTSHQLMLSNIHLGHNLNFLTYKMKPYLLGKRQSFTIFNLSNTQVQLKICINMIVNIVSKRQKLLLVKENDLYNMKRLFQKAKFSKYIIMYDKKWIGGILTNFRVVRQSPKLFLKNAERSHIQYMRYLPSLVFIPDTNLSNWILFEAFNLQIPTAAVTDSNSLYFDIINYPLVGNNKSYESIYFFFCIIRNAILKGMRVEYLQILKLRRKKELYVK